MTASQPGATEPRRRPGPTPPGARSLAPDLARGVMLLFIALANSHYFLTGPAVHGGYPRDGSALDDGVTWVLSTFVDGRAYPMFGLLFGYGVAIMAARQADQDAGSVRRLLWRRSLALVAVGALHGLLLYVGDIIAAYGVLLLLGAWTVRWRDRWLLLAAAAFFVLTALPSLDSSTVGTDPPDSAMLPTDALSMIADRAAVTWFIAVLGPLGFACPFLVGAWAGRRRLLEDVAHHRTLLRVVAAVGIGAAVLGAQPIALMLAGVTRRPGDEVLELVGPLHDASGVFGGFGYAALVALVAARMTGPRGRLVTALAATGQRSLTCYLAQSVVWAVVFTPFLLDLAGPLGVASTALLAVATWAATVALAEAMRLRGERGPFERLVRRVTYGRRT